MKKILYLLIVAAMILCACKKEPQPVEPVRPPILHLPVPPTYLPAVENYLRQHVSDAGYNNIDFDQCRLSKQKAHWYLRVGLKNKLLATDFVLLQTDSLGNTSDGRFIHLQKIGANRTNFNGAIDISSLDKKTAIHSAVTNGYVEAYHAAMFANTGDRKNDPSGMKTDIVPGSWDELPEVIVVAYLPVVNEGSSFSFADYMMLQSFFSGGSGGGFGGAGGINDGYGPNGITGGSTTYSYNGGYYPNGGGEVWQPTQYQQPADLPDIAVAPDNSYLRPAIDMNAWMKCFTDIPDAGASCSVTLLGDLPVDTDPTIGLNLWSGNTGHCFLQLTKTNGVQSVTQIIGFTAESPMKAVVNTEAFVPGKTVDNAGHKYDCSITMNLGADGFNTVINKMKSLSAVMPYSVVNYDCLDYGLEVFNSVRASNPLRIPKVYSVSDPFSNIANGPKLYTVLENMVAGGSPEAANITLGGPRYAGESHGACN